VAAVVGGSQALVLPLLAADDTRAAALLGALLAAVNTVLAHFLATWSAGRSVNVFMGAVLGGMLGRMALMLGAVVASVLLLGLPKVPLAISLLSYFVIFLVVELSLLHGNTSKPAVAR
jgi:hypothetical protein